MEAERYKVKWVPIRCPKCKSKRKRTGKVDGRVRYHKCLDCDTNYASIEA